MHLNETDKCSPKEKERIKRVPQSPEEKELTLKHVYYATNINNLPSHSYLPLGRWAVPFSPFLLTKLPFFLPSKIHKTKPTKAPELKISSFSSFFFISIYIIMASRRKQRWSPQPLTPLMEGPDFEMEDHEGNKKESPWEVIRDWFGLQKNVPGGTEVSSSSSWLYGPNTSPASGQDLRLLLGVLGCPLAPIPIPSKPSSRLHIKDIPLETSTAYYIIQQYLAATGCSKQRSSAKNMYASGLVKLVRCETEIATGKSVKTVGSRCGENGCFVLWRMSPGMWSLELAVAGNKVMAGSDGKTVWRHTPWLGTHAAKGPQRPLRRIIQGLDPKTTASLFAKAQCLGEKTIGSDDCFVLKVAADRAAVMERSEGPAEAIRHVLYGYFSQKSGLLIYMEDSHLTRVQSPDQNDAVYWETTIGSGIGDYRDVDGVLIAHQGRTVATVFRFGETSMEHSRTRMEEMWSIQDVVFNVPGLSGESFIPPADIFDSSHTVSP